MSDRAAHVVSQVGGGVAVGSAFAGWIIENHQLISGIGVLVGIAVAVGGFLVSWYYKHKQTQILERGGRNVD